MVMVFEDLCPHGYAMKSEAATLPEAKIVLQKLARFHAASKALADTIPVIKTMANGLGTTDLGKFIEIWLKHFDMIGQLCQQWPGFEQYTEKLEKLKHPIFEQLKVVYTPDPTSSWNVLNHGDLHYKNMMFKINEGVTEDIMLLDFQISVWATPAIDLLYSLYNTVGAETRHTHREELISYYYEQFAEALKKFGYSKKIPTLVDLRVELIKAGHLETLVSLVFLPYMVLTPEQLIPQPKSGDPEEGVEMDFENVVGCYSYPAVQTLLKQYLPMLNHKGLLDL
ncbi:uncharacterized protein LOC129753700 [Uranotaenia lowii]|uniref:uncharacterized protein LOC129753700 n=1 Tax=Uranotaenia lowii TaxID=190385 RepID=UPI00247A014E|nr:uncharacterized protein LOC129753700 [Uranotaenia lowii]